MSRIYALFLTGLGIHRSEFVQNVQNLRFFLTGPGIEVNLSKIYAFSLTGLG